MYEISGRTLTSYTGTSWWVHHIHENIVNGNIVFNIVFCPNNGNIVKRCSITEKLLGTCVGN